MTAGGYTQPSNVNVNTIEYVQISTLGNALDFGDIATATRGLSAIGNPTRIVFAGGIQSNDTTDMTFVTISSKGNSVRFGDLTSARRMDGHGNCSNSIRGLFMHANAPADTGIDFITIASEGNAVFFADGLKASASAVGEITCFSNNTRGVMGGGHDDPHSTSIQYVNIANTGQIFDFGTLERKKRGSAGLSDSHGGLGGF